MPRSGDTVKQYKISFKYEANLRKLREIQSKLNSFRKMQVDNATRIARSETVIRRNSGKQQLNASKTVLAEMLREEEKNANARRKVQESVSAARVGAATGRLSGSQNSAPRARDTALADQLRQEEKNANARIKVQEGVAAARVRAAAGRLSGSQNVSPKAKDTALADQLRQEEQLAKQQDKLTAKAVDYNSHIKMREKYIRDQARAEEQRVKQLNKAIQREQNSYYWQTASLSAEEAQVREEYRKQILQAKTADQVREIAARQNAIRRDSRAQTRGLRTQEFLTRRMAASARQFAGNFLSVFAAVSIGRNIMRTALDMQSFRVAMDSVSESAELGAENFEYVRREAYRLGLDLRGAARGFSQILAAGQGQYTLEDMRDIFTSVSEAATAMHLSQEDVNGTILAIQQMMSKGKVQAQELRLQLGNRLSPAFRLFAEAMGVSTAQLDKMMEQGQVISKDVLPKFAARLKAFAANGLDNALNSWVTAMNRMRVAFSDMADELVNRTGLADGLKDFFDSIEQLISQNMPLWHALGQIIGTVFEVISVAIKAVTPLIVGIGDQLNLLTKNMWLFTAAAIAAFSVYRVGSFAVAIKAAGRAMMFAFSLSRMRSFSTVWSSILDLKKLSLFNSRIVTIGMAFSKWLIRLTLIAAIFQEIENLFTRDKIGILYDKSTGEYITDSIPKPFRTIFRTPSSMSSQLKWIDEQNKADRQKSSSSPVTVNVPPTTTNVYLDGEQISQTVSKSQAIETAIDSRVEHTME